MTIINDNAIEEPYDDLEQVLASIGHSLLAKDLNKEAEIFSRANCFLEFLYEDGWNGGTSAWNLVIEIEYPIFVTYTDESRKELEQFIDQVIAHFQPEYGHWISSKLKALPFNDPNWRKSINNSLINHSSGSPSESLKELITKRDIQSIEEEFTRAINKLNTEPREAVSASCNILESIFKVYIADENLTPPKKQDLQGIWKVVRADLGFKTNRLEDDDLKKIISGILSIVDGIGAFRTHASSAHGQGRNAYRIKPRHARLAVHSAHTLAMFVLETWDEKTENSKK